MDSVLKIGHRGAKGHLAENTLESIQLALDFGVDMIEIDVHRCNSGEIVVIHDFTLDRTTNGSGEIANKDWSTLKELKVAGAYKIPLLTEVLDLIEGKSAINIELKGSNTAEATCKIVQDYVENRNWNYSDFIISSFQVNELFEARKFSEKIPIGVLSKASISEAIKIGKELNALAIHPSIGIVTKDKILQTKKAGFKVIVWTVNEPDAIARMQEFGVDGIISDYPDRLVKVQCLKLKGKVKSEKKA
ncbi:glycerophosphodiester phosphodiesterase family protein [Salegentibacter sp. F188]|uniref:Glycerophosphodiester phosphodiesterase family protein n=1 Tax=Autumnicola patrickiae TaxID=3075591 RepID=A0ABU3E6D8_9FLAO|nr:glycerophosphodiester phosphodiesterase family protein [Salegentibacter sp. F188]MDT0691495.1 glycerophosphodiester phosphodiesterase family protein [Salegentibacter sp. F188]